MLSLFSGLYGRHCLCQVYDADEQGRDHHVLQGRRPLAASLLLKTWIFQNALITMRNGALYLLVRLADLRMKHLIECHVNGHFLMKVGQWPISISYLLSTGGNRWGWRDSKPFEQRGFWQVLIVTPKRSTEKYVSSHLTPGTKTIAALWKATWRKDPDLQITSRFCSWLANKARQQSAKPPHHSNTGSPIWRPGISFGDLWLDKVCFGGGLVLICILPAILAAYCGSQNWLAVSTLHNGAQGPSDLAIWGASCR